MPSAAATSASGRACAISSRTSSAVTFGRSAASTTTPSPPRAARARAPTLRGEVAPAVVEHVGAERARRGVHLGVGRDDADREPGLQAGAHDAPQQEQHEVAARIGVEHVGQTRLAARQRLDGHQRQPPAMGTGYHRAESMSPSSALPPLRLGYKASAEQFAPAELLSFGVAAERLGLDSVAVSDHFQPFRHDGGHSPASLPWLGALAAQTSRVLIGTSVLTPTYRYHPAVVAQAFATLGCLAPGRIFLGLGVGRGDERGRAHRHRLARRRASGSSGCARPWR